MGDEAAVVKEAGTVAPARRRTMTVVAVVAGIGYLALLFVGLAPPNRSFGWEQLYCPVLAGPGGTASPVQQLRFGPDVCASGEGPRVATVVGLAALAGLAGAAALAALRSSPRSAGDRAESRAPGRHRALSRAVAAVTVVAMLAPLSVFVVWHRRDDPTLGPDPVQAIVTPLGLCIPYAGGTWSSASGADGQGLGAIVPRHDHDPRHDGHLHPGRSRCAGRRGEGFLARRPAPGGRLRHRLSGLIVHRALASIGDGEPGR